MAFGGCFSVVRIRMDLFVVLLMRATLGTVVILVGRGKHASQRGVELSGSRGCLNGARSDLEHA